MQCSNLPLQRHFRVLTKFAHVESRLSGRRRQREEVFYTPVNLCDRRPCSTSVAVGVTCAITRRARLEGHHVDSAPRSSSISHERAMTSTHPASSKKTRKCWNLFSPPCCCCHCCQPTASFHTLRILASHFDSRKRCIFLYPIMCSASQQAIWWYS